MESRRGFGNEIAVTFNPESPLEQRSRRSEAGKTDADLKIFWSALAGEYRVSGLPYLPTFASRNGMWVSTGASCQRDPLNAFETKGRPEILATLGPVRITKRYSR